MFKKIVLFLALAVFSASCSSNKTEHKQNEEPKNKKQVILKINGVDVDNSELIDYTYFIVQEMDPKALDNPDVRNRLIHDFIVHKLLLEEVKRRNLHFDEEKDSKVAGYIEKMEEGKAANSDDNATDEVAKARLKKQMLENLYVQKLLALIADENIRISDDDLKEYYNKNKTAFQVKRSANVFMILTADKEKADEAMGELKKGVPFSEVAEKYSISDEGRNGGNLGFIEAEDYPEVFAEAFKLKAGETSGIIKSEYGYHIFRTTAFRNGENKKFEQVKSEIYAQLYAEKQEESVRNFIDELYKKAEIINVSPAVFDTSIAGTSTDN